MVAFTWSLRARKKSFKKYTLRVDDEVFTLWWDQGLKIEGYDLSDELLALKVMGTPPPLWLHLLLRLEMAGKEAGESALGKLLKENSSFSAQKECARMGLLERIYKLHRGKAEERMDLAEFIADKWSLDILLSDEEPVVLTRVCWNPNITVNHLERLMRENRETVMPAILMNPKVPMSWIEDALKNNDKSEISYSYICSNPSCPSESLEELLTQSLNDLNASPKKLSTLHIEIRIDALLGNPNLSDEVILKTLPRLNHKYWVSHLGRRKNMSPQLRRAILADLREEVRAEAARCWDLTRQEQKVFLNDTSRVRAGLALNGNLYFMVYDSLYGDLDVLIKIRHHARGSSRSEAFKKSFLERFFLLPNSIEGVKAKLNEDSYRPWLKFFWRFLRRGRRVYS